MGSKRRVFWQVYADFGGSVSGCEYATKREAMEHAERAKQPTTITTTTGRVITLRGCECVRVIKRWEAVENNRIVARWRV